MAITDTFFFTITSYYYFIQFLIRAAVRQTKLPVRIRLIYNRIYHLTQISFRCIVKWNTDTNKRHILPTFHIFPLCGFLFCRHSMLFIPFIIGYFLGAQFFHCTYIKFTESVFFQTRNSLFYHIFINSHSNIPSMHHANLPCDNRSSISAYNYLKSRMPVS